jgi:Lipoprotein NlpI, contains TPR repeats
LGDHKAAINSFDHALKINPDFVNAYYNKGLSLVELKECNGALECFKKVLKLDPKDKNAKEWVEEILSYMS